MLNETIGPYEDDIGSDIVEKNYIIKQQIIPAKASNISAPRGSMFNI